MLTFSKFFVAAFDNNNHDILLNNNQIVSPNNVSMSITDCSGFVNALLKKSYNLSSISNNWLGVPRPYASTYYRAIMSETYFKKITNINDANIGDFIVFRILPGTSKSDNTGHIMLINQQPILMRSQPPIITENHTLITNSRLENNTILPKTLQWTVNIIDQSSEHGPTDSRYPNKTGLGTGNFRIYTDHAGNLQGYSWSTQPNSKYIDHSVHPLVIGHLDII